MPSIRNAPNTELPGLTLRDALTFLAHPQKSFLACVLLLLAVSGMFFFYGMNTGDLWRTESLRAIIAAEFLRTGNWIVPMLYGEPLFTKPPGMYAAIALCSWPCGGVTDWSARLPSALAATATVFLIYWYFGRQLGRLGGLVAALILPLAPMWLEKATAAEIDMLQVAWTTAAILFFLRALETSVTEQQARPEFTRLSSSHRVIPYWWLAAFLCVAGGVLTKWTTPLFFYGTVLPLLAWRGQLRLLVGKQHLAGVVLALGLCLAWAALAVSLTGWDVFASTIEREALARLSPGHSPRPYPWRDSLLHPLKLLINTLPFSTVALVTLRPGFFRLWDERGRRLLQALHCWTWPNMLLMSLPTEHTPRHSFPLFPGLAGLAAMVFLAWMTGRLAWRLPRIQPRQVLIGALIGWMGLKLGYVHAVVPHHTARGQPRAKGEWLAGLIPLDQILYIFNLKDEGIMFYYGRPILRLQSPKELPRSAEPVYCILLPSELAAWQAPGRPEVVRHMTDGQGDPIILVRVTPS